MMEREREKDVKREATTPWMIDFSSSMQ